MPETVERGRSMCRDVNCPTTGRHNTVNTRISISNLYRSVPFLSEISVLSQWDTVPSTDVRLRMVVEVRYTVFRSVKR